MKGSLSIWPEKLAKKGVRGNNRDLMIFAFFLFLSFVFWYLNSLGKVTESEIKYPVRYINPPKERVLIEDLPSRLDILVKGPGYSILKLKLLRGRTPVILNISSVSYRRVAGAKSLRYYVKTSTLMSMLSGQIGNECSITSIRPDTLYFTFDKEVTRKIPVIPDLNIFTERQYFVKGNISVIPDSVNVTGPKNVLDTLSCVKTEYRRFTGLNRTIRRSLGLKSSRYYTLSEKSASITIPVEQFTEAEASVPIRILNPPSFDIKIFPDAVTVTGLVAISDYKKFKELPFEVVLDLAKANLESEKRIPLEIRNIPPFITSVRLTPPDVDFLIEKPNDEK